MKIVAYYTSNTPYEQEALAFEDSFRGQNYHIFKVDNLGQWELNCAQKPTIIKKALELFKEDILYLDIDARLVSSLPPIPSPNKIGICMWNPIWKSNTPELLSGTIYFPNNSDSLTLVNDWIEHQKLTPTVWDQKVLQSIIHKYDYELLDLKWVFIEKFMSAFVSEPIILHTQCSRRLKNLVGK
jgi:hypothetical protein